MKADCPNPPQQFGVCYNCGEDGHSKAECPKPKVFTGTCNFCGTKGHPAARCPLREPIVCKNCKEEGHSVKDCHGYRKFDMSGVEDKSPEDAWAMMKEACDGEIDDFRKV
ncbi:hypothetical protein N7523_002444 [Penicillium sp. IBT 18751x]|nr:hypothetical protein N7523_002444 [Penicillium sp. IBT 18751x]